MIGFIVLLLLLLAFYEGARRGTAYQLVYLVVFVVSFIIANSTYEKIAKSIELYVPYMSVTADTKFVFFTQTQSFDLDKSFYAMFSFFMVVLIGWLLTKIIAIFFTGLRFVNLLGKYDWALGGVINVGIIFTLIFFVVFILALVPIDSVQQLLQKGSQGYHIFKDSPFLSHYFYQHMITDIIG